MQHAARLDQIEAAADRTELKNVGLRIFDIVQSERARLTHRIAEARQAEIHREHLGASETPAAFDSVLAGAAARDQHVQALARAERAYRSVGKLVAQIPAERDRLSDRSCRYPAGIGHVLVLATNLLRYLIVNAREGRDGRADFSFLQRFTKLLFNEPSYRV